MGINELGLKIVQALLPVVVAFVTALVGYGIAFLKKKINEIENDTIRKS